MPTYDYECTNCKHKFEAFQKMTDALLEKCPECKGPVRRLISTGVGVIFKGSGFYATDYKKRPKADKAKDAPSVNKDTNTCAKAKDDKGCKGCPSNPNE